MVFDSVAIPRGSRLLNGVCRCRPHYCGFWPKVYGSWCCADTCTHLFIAALFWNREAYVLWSNVGLLVDWINPSCAAHTWRGLLCSRTACCFLCALWATLLSKLEMLVLSKVSRGLKAADVMFSLICGTWAMCLLGHGFCDPVTDTGALLLGWGGGGIVLGGYGYAGVFGGLCGGAMNTPCVRVSGHMFGACSAFWVCTLETVYVYAVKKLMFSQGEYDCAVFSAVITLEMPCEAVSPVSDGICLCSNWQNYSEMPMSSELNLLASHGVMPRLSSQLLIMLRWNDCLRVRSLLPVLFVRSVWWLLCLSSDLCSSTIC